MYVLRYGFLFDSFIFQNIPLTLVAVVKMS